MIGFSTPRRLSLLRAGTLIALMTAWVPVLVASEFRSTKDMRDVSETTIRYIELFGPEHVLLVADNDNTLLAMDQSLGSDQWFQWQSYLLDQEPNSPHLVAKSFDGLLVVQGLLFQSGSMHPPQPDLPQIMKRIQDRGINTLVLTSRGHEFREATERELYRNGYDFRSTALTVPNTPAVAYLPCDPDNPSSSGLTAREIDSFQLQDPKPVAYFNGIMMCAGQHKGAMLLTLLHRTDRDIKAVVFVDDSSSHVGRVFASMVDRGIEVTSFHYRREEDRVQAFNYGDQCDAINQWLRFQWTSPASSIEYAEVDTDSPKQTVTRDPDSKDSSGSKPKSSVSPSRRHRRCPACR